MSTNSKAKPRKFKEKIDLDEITNKFMNEGLKPNIHTSTEGAVGGINNDPWLDLDSEIARLENKEASLKNMLTLKQLIRNISSLHNNLQHDEEPQQTSTEEPRILHSEH